MRRCKRNKRKGAKDEVQEDASPHSMSQQGGEIEVNTTGSVGSPGHPEHLAFGVRKAKERTTTTHLSHPICPNSAPQYDGQTLSPCPSGSKGGSKI